MCFLMEMVYCHSQHIVRLGANNYSTSLREDALVEIFFRVEYGCMGENVVFCFGITFSGCLRYDALILCLDARER